MQNLFAHCVNTTSERSHSQHSVLVAMLQNIKLTCKIALLCIPAFHVKLLYHKRTKTMSLRAPGHATLQPSYCERAHEIPLKNSSCVAE